MLKKRALIIVLFLFAVMGCAGCGSNNSSSLSINYRANATAAAVALQEYYNCEVGLYVDETDVYWWVSANGLESLIDYVMLTASDELLTIECFGADVDVISYTFENAPILLEAPNFINDFYDDNGWWALTWIKAYDYTNEPRYLEMAKTIFAEMTEGWDETTCNGGLWWKKNPNQYKAAIQNELFMLVAARLYLRTSGEDGSDSYLVWAQRTWEWFKNSGMINEVSLINNGLDQDNDCRNDGLPTWTYNQGVILGALVDLFKITNEIELLARAQAIAQTAAYTLRHTNGVLQEVCEPSANCDSDQASFKGIFMRYFAYLYNYLNLLSPSTLAIVKGETVPLVQDSYLKTVNSPNYNTLTFYENFITLNADSLWTSARNTSNQFGVDWVGPFESDSVPKQTSALAGLNEAIPFDTSDTTVAE